MHFLESEYTPSPPQQARFHIIPTPMEQSVSYGQGTALGPAAILAASQQLEKWDGASCPGDAGLYTYPAVDCTGTPAPALDRIESAVRQCLHAHTNALPVLLGGEHSATLGALRALVAHETEPFGVVQFDAHADLRAQYAGNAYSHACIMHWAVCQYALPLAQYGVRELCPEEITTRKTHGIIHYDAPVLARNGLPDIPLPDNFPQRIYVSFDVDALDAALMPATGTPSPGGLGWYDALTLVERCVRGRTVIGLDVMEFAPVPSLHFADFTAARLVYSLMGIVQRNSCINF